MAAARANKGRSEEELNNNGSFKHEQSRWRKPEERETKCNIDVAIFKEEGYYSIGMCLRGRHI